MTILDPFTNKGFFTIAQNTPYCDYVRLAYAQALSIKLTQTVNDYAIGVDAGTPIPAKYKQVFDHVIEIPWGDGAAGQSWKLGNEWKAGYMSPFDQTVKLDSDMLFFRDLREWWALFDRYDLIPTTQVQTYRGERATSQYYRKSFVANQLPNFYSAFFYFRKTEANFTLFDTTRVLFENWAELGPQLMDHTRPEQLPTDDAFALAVKLLGIPLGHRLPTFVHMKKHMHNVDTADITEHWHKHLDYYFDRDMNLFIENFKQTVPVHYHCKDFVTDALIKQYEKALGI